MQSWTGNITKMHVSVDTEHSDSSNQVFKPLYQLPIGDASIDMSALIGHSIKVVYSGNIHCINCSRKTNKSFSQGYCFPCMRSLARCDMCIMKPELCHYAQGTCREPQWGESNCLQDHFVYLANTGQVKVGITKFVNGSVSSRWFDQGATQAVPIFRVKERLLSGLLEIEVAKHVADKTNWRLMLKGVPNSLNLQELQQKVYALVADKVESLQAEYGLQAVQKMNVDPIDIDYPVLNYPSKIKSINLDKEGQFEGVLKGIKGQYLLLDEDRVINLRKYTGYELSIHA